MSLKIGIPTINATCNECGAQHTGLTVDDFRESNTMPPSVHFMCRYCDQMATLKASDIPSPLFAKLVNKIARERGINDNATFINLTPL